MYCQILCLWLHRPHPSKHCGFCKLFSAHFNSDLPATFCSLMFGPEEMDGSHFQCLEPQVYGVNQREQFGQPLQLQSRAWPMWTELCLNSADSASLRGVCAKASFHGEQQKEHFHYFSDLWVKVSASFYEGYFISSICHGLWFQTSILKAFMYEAMYAHFLHMFLTCICRKLFIFYLFIYLGYHQHILWAQRKNIQDILVHMALFEKEHALSHDLGSRRPLVLSLSCRITSFLQQRSLQSSLFQETAPEDMKIQTRFIQTK